MKLKILILFLLSTSLYAQGYFITPNAIPRTINSTEKVDSVTNLFTDVYSEPKLQFSNKLRISNNLSNWNSSFDEGYSNIGFYKTTSSDARRSALQAHTIFSGSDNNSWTFGLNGSSNIKSTSGTITGTRSYGVHGFSGFNGSGSLNFNNSSNQMVGVYGLAFNESSLSLTTPLLIGVQGEINIFGSGSITTGYSFYADYYDGGGGVLSNWYGYYSKGAIGSPATNQWHFYGLGNYPSYFGGDVRAGKFMLNALNTAPAASTSTGTLGEIRIDANYIYICVATNTWKRVALNETTW